MDESKEEPLIYRIAPGLPALLRYQWALDFRHDLLAGVSVAAVALPVAVAYAQLAGFNPVVGLYSCILPLVAYALFGTSRQLIVSADASTCAMVAAAVMPLAAGNPDHYWSLSVTLAFLSGLFCIGASFFRLGALADFLSKPILIGFMNGISISIFLGQIGKLFGFSIESSHVIPRLHEFLTKLPQTHVLTLVIGLGTFVVLYLARRFVPQLPAALVAMVFAGATVAGLGLDEKGVAILGIVPAGLPSLRFPVFPAEHLPTLVFKAAGIALVLFSSGMLTARSFAAKNRYDIDVDREFTAFGVANIASAFSQGFAVTGADSRTAMADAAGGRTQVTGLVAAAMIAMVLVFFTHPLQYIPVSALGAVLVYSSFTLFDVRTLRRFWKLDRTEVGLAVTTTLGVVTFGAIDAILVAVTLALARFVKLIARPQDEILGQVEGMDGLHSVERHPDAQTFPGLVVYRFNSPIAFFNSAYFKQRVLRAAKTAGPDLKWFVIDMIPITKIDLTGMDALQSAASELEEQGIRLFFAGRKTQHLNWLRQTGLYRPEHDLLFFPTLKEALKAWLETNEKPLKQ